MSKTGDIKTGNLAADQLQEYSNLIKQRAQFYREENTQMEEIFRKLKLLSDELKLTGLGGSVENLDKIMAELETKSLPIEKAELGQAEKLRKRNNYLSKLKICIRHYINLNENVSKQIKSLKSEVEHPRQNVNNVLKLYPQDIQQLEEKAKKYENELAKFEVGDKKRNKSALLRKKYPWLKQTDYNLPNIAKHIDTLKSLKEEKDNLLKDLSYYQNLKPDIKEARQQLAELKDQVTAAVINFKV